MPSNQTISDLRDHLFATIAALRDEAKPMDVARAKAVSEVARQIIDSAKVEVEHLRVTGGHDGTGFIPQPPTGQLPGPSTNGAGGNGITGVTRHLLKG
jgi:hypothetical protein